MNKIFDIVILGGGASGFACALSALKRGRKVAILEHNASPLQKVKVSGGGRCNFTNLKATAYNYVTGNKDLVLKTLKNFSPTDFLDILKKYNISYTEKAKGQLFAQGSAQDIITVLRKEAEKAEVFYNITIEETTKTTKGYIIQTDQGSFQALSLVIATGGLSYPSLGADDMGYKIAKSFGHKISPCRPALVPFTLDNELMKELIKLKGISLDVEIKCNDKVFKDGMVFTHFGISGPAVLQASLYWNKGDKIVINLLPNLDIEEVLKKHREGSKGKKISNILGNQLPAKLKEYILADKDVFISEAGNKLIKDISQRINKWQLEPIGTQGYKLAEVTLGGVDATEVKESFESLKSEGLFIVGEVLDVTGQLGGFNLQWAWSSGFIAGQRA